MCCIFTCCGWMVDLMQRAWTFSMTCIIMSAVSVVLATSSMAGIALGYNYSLAEYIDLKETNVSVYLKRGVFDDEIADDIEWRRAGNQPNQNSGQNRDDNLRAGADDDESTTLRSGRRLDDSVFEADDQHKYEGSLMKLTAKPVYQNAPPPHVTDDMEIAESITKHPLGSLDQLKAIQSLIDSRRAMATSGTTLSPLATYASEGPLLPYLPSFNNPNIPIHPEVQYRRMMAPAFEFRRNMEPVPIRSVPGPVVNPARLAVPDPATLNSQVNWLGPKSAGIYVQSVIPEFFITSPTYPPPITVSPATIRPTAVSDSRRYPGSINFPYGFSPRKPSPTYPPPMLPEQEQIDNQPDLYNEKNLLEGEEMSKNDINMGMPRMGMRSPEEEYEDEIKGLPVRKRRSIIVSTLIGEGKNTTERNIIPRNKSTRNNGNLSSVNNIITTTIRTIGTDMYANSENNFTINKKQSVVEEINDSHISTKISNKNNTNQQIDMNEKRKSNMVKQVEIIRKHDQSENKKEKSLLDRLVTLIGNKEASQVAETTPEASVIKSDAEKIRIKTRRKSFESEIVSSKYVSNNTATRVEKKQSLSNQEILNSISIGLNEAGLLRNPASSTFVTLLQATLTA